MKRKNSKWLKIAIISFSFIFAFFILFDVKVNAASTDFYFSKEALSSNYDNSGNAIIKDTIDIYAHNNGAGYQIDNSKLRVYSVTIKNGNFTATYKIDDKEYNFSDLVSVSNNQEMPTDGSYAQLNVSSKLVDKITLKISSMLSGTDISNNKVQIEFSLQQNQKILFISNWKEYTTAINYYIGDAKQTSNNATLNKTNASFASSKLEIVGLELKGSNLSCSYGSTVCYNLKDFNNGKALNLTVNVNFPFTGTIRAYYSSSNYVALNFTNQSRSSVNLKISSNIIAKDVQTRTYTFNKFEVYNAKDKYDSSITRINSNSHSLSFTIDTSAPKVTSAGIRTTGGTYYDLTEINPQFRFNEKARFNLKMSRFNVGADTQSIKCLNGCISNSDDQSFSQSNYISGEGKVTLTGFEATITDLYGNVTNYYISNTSSLCNINTNVTLASSITMASTAKSYYYNGEQIDIEVTLKSASISSSDYTKIQLVLSNNQTYEINNSVKIGNILHLYYVVDNKSLTIDNLQFYKSYEGNSTPVLVYAKEFDIHLNEYLDLSLDESEFINPYGSSVIIYSSSETRTFNTDQISLSNQDAPILTLSCSHSTYIDSCNYESVNDGIIDIKVSEGAIILNNGQKNSLETFKIIVNTRAPLIKTNGINISNDKTFEYNEVIYYKDGENLMTFDLEDGYSDSKCIYYKFNDSEYNYNCDNTLEISFPNVNGNYTLTYYTSDGVNNSDEVIYSKVFNCRNSFELNDIEINVNNIGLSKDIVNIDENKKFNYLNISYSNAKGLDLLDEFKVFIYVKNTFITSSNKDSFIFAFAKDDFALIDDSISIKISLIDKINNILEYNFKVNIDTIDPIFDNVVTHSNKVDDKYVVTISGIGDNEIYVKVDGVRVELNNNTFTCDKEKYVIGLIDKAGNSAEKVFTTVSPSVEMFMVSNSTYDVKYEIDITPFDSSIHEIEEFRYLVFDYLTNISEYDLEVANSNVCTVGRKVNCYIDGTFKSDSYLINQTFTKGYSYILQIRVNNVLVNDKNSGRLPRIDVLVADLLAPNGGYLDEDVNPDYISSSSSSNFKFSFVAMDNNLVSNYYYLVVKSNLTPNMNVTNFYDLYRNCYGANSTSNGCGIRGENAYVEEIEEGTFLGEVIIESNATTKRRLENNTTYSLYVLLTDTSNNATVFRVREFRNITQPSYIEYFNDSDRYENISNGDSVTTINTTRVRISKYENINISSVVIDNVSRTCSPSGGCSFELGVGRHVVEVSDALGNVNKVTIFSGVANSPVIHVYYLYKGEYFRIVDTSFAYNTSNADKVYVKVVANNLEMVRISMNTTSTYQQGETIFDQISDTRSSYGMNLLDIMSAHNGSEFSGDITINAINENGGESSITLIVDNERPYITMYPAGSKINLLGSLYNLEYDNNNYILTFNYQRDITYSYLMKALSLKVDGIAFEDIISSNRLNFKVNGLDFSNFEDSIIKGEKLINIDYFDNAGNEAETINILINVFDNEKPIISLNETLSTVELNMDVSLATVILSDNHDSYQDLELTVTINSENIDYTNYRFLDLGEYDVVYSVKDTSNNIATITQKVTVIDTRAPTLEDGTITNYFVALEEELVFNLPKFIDSDKDASIYYPYKIDIVDLNNNKIDPTSATYPLLIEDDIVKIRFNEEFKLGIYKVIFIVKDSSNNVNEEVFNISLVDSAKPNIEVTLNGRNIEKNSINNLPWGSEINLSIIAMDDYDGDLTSNINKKVSFNGNVIGSVNTNKSGDYLVELIVKDSSNNEEQFSFTIRINKDIIPPVIERVLINDKELLVSGITRVNGSRATFVVEASDDSFNTTSSIVINGMYSVASGETISLESGLSGQRYTIEVIVKDSSNNETRRTYNIMIDNVFPDVSGVEDANVYTSRVSIGVYDDNIKSVTIYKNNKLYQSFNDIVENCEVSEQGLYKVVAEDSYGNITNIIFAMLSDTYFNIMGSDNIANTYSYDTSYLVEVNVENNTLNFILNRDANISNKDRIYLLVKYPNSNYKYIVYSMNGESYLANSQVSISDAIIEGVDNVDLLEKIDDKYYGYVMIIRDSNLGSSDNSNKGSNQSAETLRYIGLGLLTVFGISALLIIIIRIRRKVRAI